MALLHTAEAALTMVFQVQGSRLNHPQVFLSVDTRIRPAPQRPRPRRGEHPPCSVILRAPLARRTILSEALARCRAHRWRTMRTSVRWRRSLYRAHQQTV